MRVGAAGSGLGLFVAADEWGFVAADERGIVAADEWDAGLWEVHRMLAIDGTAAHSLTLLCSAFAFTCPAFKPTSSQELVDRALKIKIEGTERFRQKDYCAASRKYIEAADLVEGMLEDRDCTGSLRAAASILGTQCWCNVALSDWKQGKHLSVVRAAAQALIIDPACVKALLRTTLSAIEREVQDYQLAELSMELYMKGIRDDEYNRENMSKIRRELDRLKQGCPEVVCSDSHQPAPARCPEEVCKTDSSEINSYDLDSPAFAQMQIDSNEAWRVKHEGNKLFRQN